jgi:hypothetical protein
LIFCTDNNIDWSDIDGASEKITIRFNHNIIVEYFIFEYTKCFKNKLVIVGMSKPFDSGITLDDILVNQEGDVCDDDDDEAPYGNGLFNGTTPELNRDLQLAKLEEINRRLYDIDNLYYKYDAYTG